MEKNSEKEKISQEEPKIVNLCEDMNPHEHDVDSYNKMKSLQEKGMCQ